MHLHETSEADRPSRAIDGRHHQRAGVRVPVATRTGPYAQPTHLFAAVEMAVLVIVTALAMVSVIVSSADDRWNDATARTANAQRSETRGGFDGADHEAKRAKPPAQTRPSAPTLEAGQ